MSLDAHILGFLSIYWMSMRLAEWKIAYKASWVRLCDTRKGTHTFTSIFIIWNRQKLDAFLWYAKSIFFLFSICNLKNIMFAMFIVNIYKLSMLWMYPSLLSNAFSVTSLNVYNENIHKRWTCLLHNAHSIHYFQQCLLLRSLWCFSLFFSLF